MNLSKLPGLFVFLLLCGCAANNASTLSSARRAEIAQIDESLKLVAGHHFDEAEAVIQPVIHDKQFGRLPSAEQYRALLMAARLAYTLKQPKLEYESRVRLLALPEATSDDRMSRVNAAARLGDIREIVVSLTELMKRNPERLMSADERFVVRVLRDGKKQLPHGSTLPLLQALYAAHWKLQWDQEPSGLWLDLVLMLLERDRLPEAIEVSRV
jgi:hypothetical protein